MPSTYKLLLEELDAAVTSLSTAMSILERSTETFHRDYILENLSDVDKRLTLLKDCMGHVTSNEDQAQ